MDDTESVLKAPSRGVNATAVPNGRKDNRLTPYAAIQMKQELMEMSFEEILKLKEKIGNKLVNSALFQKTPVQTKEFPNTYRHRPKEMPSNKPLYQRRKVVIGRIKNKDRVTRDPRFDDLSGAFNEDLFKQSYGFVDELRADEKKVLEKELVEAKDEKVTKKIEKVLIKMTAREKEEEKKAKDKKLKSEIRKEQIASIRQGKQPYFMKKSDKKALDLVQMFEELKKEGKLDQYLAKKRQRNASKLRRKLPT